MTQEKAAAAKKNTQQEFVDEYAALVQRTGYKIAISQQTEQTLDGGLVTVHKLVVINTIQQ